MSRNSVLSVALAVAAVGVGLYFSRGPWQAYRQQKEKADLATKEMMKAEKEKTDLMQQKAKYETPMGMEGLARESGFIKPNEVPLAER